jgi:hypothetical protein
MRQPRWAQTEQHINRRILVNPKMIAALMAEAQRREANGLPELDGPELAEFLTNLGAVSSKDFRKRTRRKHYSTDAVFTRHLESVPDGASVIAAIQNAYFEAASNLGATEEAYQVVYVIDMTRDDEGAPIVRVAPGKFKDHVGRPSRSGYSAPEGAELRWVDQDGVLYESRAAYLHAKGKRITDDVIVRPCKVGNNDRLQKVWLESNGTPNAAALAAALKRLAESFPSEATAEESEENNE